jgi:beta-fructofuranosidase
VIIGWASDWQSYVPVQQEGWCGYFALPRRVELTEGDRLKFIPVEELRTLRHSPQTYAAFTLGAGERKTVSAGDGISAELIIRIDMEKTDAQALALYVRADAAGNERTRIALDFQSGELTLDLSRSDPRGIEPRRCKIEIGGKELLLHIFLDTCSVELFTGDYKTALTGNIYSNPESREIAIESMGGEIRAAGIETWGLAACAGVNFEETGVKV